MTELRSKSESYFLRLHTPLKNHKRGTKELKLTFCLRPLWIACTLSRHDQLLFVILPFLTQYAITPRDRRDQRNVQTLRRELQKIIKEKKESGVRDETLLSHMLNEDLIQDDYKVLEDDLIMFFLAGAITV